MTPTQTVAHGAEILMHLVWWKHYTGEIFSGGKADITFGLGLTVKQRKRWVQRIMFLN